MSSWLERILSFLLGGAIAILSSWLTNRFALKREQLAREAIRKNQLDDKLIDALAELYILVDIVSEKATPGHFGEDQRDATLQLLDDTINQTSHVHSRIRLLRPSLDRATLLVVGGINAYRMAAVRSRHDDDDHLSELFRNFSGARIRLENLARRELGIPGEDLPGGEPDP